MIQPSGTIRATGGVALTIDHLLPGGSWGLASCFAPMGMIRDVGSAGDTNLNGEMDLRLIRGLRVCGDAVSSGEIGFSQGVNYQFMEPSGYANAVAVCGVAYRKPMTMSGELASGGCVGIAIRRELKASGEVGVSGGIDLIDAQESTRRPGRRFGR